MKGNSVKYLSIYEELKQDIVDGKYPVGDLFPAEPDLQKRFNVSRITVRNAVKLLVDEGYVQRIHGVGTIVLSRKESLQLQTLLSFSEENSDRNVHASLHSFKDSMVADPMVCSQLELPKGATVSCHERLRWIGDVPIGFQRVYCPSFITLYAEELEGPNVSLYKLLREKGFVVTNAKETIESIEADKRLAEVLQVEENKPLLYVQRVTRDQRDRLIEYAEIFYRGDRYRYNVQLQVPR
ncbi:GntR family transcriptional regulator [Enterococcus sp. 669A]|uniref:GntR family transcriptional regulator n=1 Tax=Candidatus Enterococcus moelleringii TaxID=2815325 RepID=A0ABS3L824_9ENTE|nr:GntR family transcriptional regulator [Enterococcus sp. 669A]MBO1305762.1 GntR family transcriptional regulator [Enterococcus sp. 669A]